MRVFITGATGYIGSALVRAFVAAGHEVGGLVRKKDKEAEVKALGAVPIFGTLEDPETYQHFAAESQVVIHAAMGSGTVDQPMCEELIGAMKAEDETGMFIYTSGCLVVGTTGDAPVDEKASTEKPFDVVAWRPGVEQFVLQQGTGAFTTAVIRPGWVYGGKRVGVLQHYIQSAQQGGAAQHIGEGKNKMTFIHIDDLAQLYVLVATQKARGIFHGVDESNITNHDLATEVSKAVGKGGKTASMPLADAQKTMGPFAGAFTLNERLKSTRNAELGWTLKHHDVVGAIPEAVKSLAQ